ncbi:MAG: preprotein translocase subunit SecG [Lewinellaceae bacterium]|nr:preprotein translocase subunit SecG [Saprospiraceae bacterium]MCB9307065.1 preprotein translocase subunit SecG [Lewinellaceae bacterium]MCB9353984.1 preprotein translocase subunit SecG [Lewinellaceae bacterium]
MLSTLAVLIACVSVMLMAAVLIQNPKGGGIDATFGGQAQQLFGAARSTDFIEKATWVLAGALVVLCVIAVLTVGSGGPATPADIPLQSR